MEHKCCCQHWDCPRNDACRGHCSWRCLSLYLRWVLWGYSLSSNWASGRKCCSHHNECQSEFPNGCMFRAFFLKYWHFQIVSKLNPWAPGLCWMCHLIVAGGPRVSMVLSLHSLIAKGKRCQSTFEKFWAQKCKEYIFSRIFSCRI